MGGWIDMGMFDYVNCEMPLPDGFVAPLGFGAFQTKDMYDPCMNGYIITEDGRLVRKGALIVGLDAGAEDEPPRYDLEFHGILHFYTYTGDHNDGTAVWHGYKAKFTDGKCVEIIQDERDA